jgi:hypothetical protein
MRRLTALIETLRPRTIARAIKSVDDLVAASRELKRSIKQLELDLTKLTERMSASDQELRALRETISEVRERESRLRAVYLRDIELAPALDAVGAVLDANAVQRHVERAVDAATLHDHPFPYLVLTHLFPQSFYDAVVAGIPPVELFDGIENKQRLVVPFEMAPAYSRRVWTFLLDTVIERTLGPALIRRFEEPLGAWLATTWPDVDERDPLSALRLHCTDGRILLRRRGYVILPHRDPKWGFLTCLLYLARPGDSPEWGTQLYEVEADREAPTVAPEWIRPERCRLAKDVPFRANSALVFLNSRGAHGARIPADAEPPNLERFIYQFRIGPTAQTIRQLMAAVPDDRRMMWSGKVADYS